MKRKHLFFILLSAIILFQTSIGLAKELNLPKPNPSFYVYDEADIVDSQVERYIIKTNEELYKREGAQVVVASITSLENMDIREYANRLFEKWKIGSKEYDNGLLVLIAPEEGEIWIEVGYGLEGALPDSKVGGIIENSILPYFREGDYSQGILSGFNEIINEIEVEYNIELNRQNIDEDLYYFDNDSSNVEASNGPGRIFMILGIIIFLFIDFKFFNGWITYSLLRGGRHGGGGGRGGGSSGGGGRSGGGGAGGSW